MRKAKLSMTAEPRWVIAHDEAGYHVRETLAVKHDGITGQATYYTEPRGSRGSLREAIRLARRTEGRRT